MAWGVGWLYCTYPTAKLRKRVQRVVIGHEAHAQRRQRVGRGSRETVSQVSKDRRQLVRERVDRRSLRSVPSKSVGETHTQRHIHVPSSQDKHKVVESVQERAYRQKELDGANRVSIRSKQNAALSPLANRVLLAVDNQNPLVLCVYPAKHESLRQWIPHV